MTPSPLADTADDVFRYPEGTHGRGSLTHHGPIPVLRVAGSPEQIAEQVVALALAAAPRLLDYPLDLLAYHLRCWSGWRPPAAGWGWPTCSPCSTR
jgi:hypothetical protein